jgi:hypothetical protein
MNENTKIELLKLAVELTKISPNSDFKQNLFLVVKQFQDLPELAYQAKKPVKS